MFKNIFAFLALCSFTTAVSYVPLYDASDDVIELTPENFDKLVLKNKSTWIIQFYAPWCTHCKTLKPEYKKTARLLKGTVNVGVVNAYEYTSLAERYNIKGYPTIKFFANNKQLPMTYNGKRKADDIVQAIIFNIKQ